MFGNSRLSHTGLSATALLFAASLAAAGAKGPECKRDHHTLICHTHQGKTEFEFLCVSGSAVPGHMRHGDHIPDTFYPDADGDGYGDAAAAGSIECGQPPGTALDNTDCDDTNPDTYPGAPEHCNDSIDNNCDLLPDETQCVFVTSARYNGNLGGLTGADAKCQGLWDVAHPASGKTFMAWLSDDADNPDARFSRSSFPYVLMDAGATVIADDWADLTDGTLCHEIDVDESGLSKPHAPHHGVWANTNIGGLELFFSRHCSNWFSADLFDIGESGNMTVPHFQWTFWQSSSCFSVRELYCFEQ